MRWLAILPMLLVAACSTKMGKDGRTETTVDAKYLVKTEVDRIADTVRTDTVDGLLLIADKLYKRNPREWKKSAASREAAVLRLKLRQYKSFPELGGLREGQAAALAFSEVYEGDRVLALMFGLLTMTDAAFEHKGEFYILDALDERKLYNSARNMEVALRRTYDATPEPKLVVAVGDCACDGGIFGESYACRGRVANVLPVDVTIPGCPPPPIEILKGILTAVRRVPARAAR